MNKCVSDSRPAKPGVANAGRIRRMNNRELAQLYCDWMLSCLACPFGDVCKGGAAGALKWLEGR